MFFEFYVDKIICKISDIKFGFYVGIIKRDVMFCYKIVYFL